MKKEVDPAAKLEKKDFMRCKVENEEGLGESRREEWARIAHCLCEIEKPWTSLSLGLNTVHVSSGRTRPPLAPCPATKSRPRCLSRSGTKENSIDDSRSSSMMVVVTKKKLR